MSSTIESSDASGDLTGKSLKLDTHSMSENSETRLLLLEKWVEGKKQNQYRISYTKMFFQGSFREMKLISLLILKFLNWICL